MKGIMSKRVVLTILLAMQMLGAGAVTLAHARDVLVVSPGVEASHTARCAILHDEVRCALCHYASARVVTQQAFRFETPVAGVRVTPVQPVTSVHSHDRVSAPARAPPSLLS
jgi:hypothetical protein